MAPPPQPPPPPPPPSPLSPTPSLLPSPPASLPEELIEEILLRFPPKDPAALVRATLVCKRWRSLVSGPGFRRRFREFHRTPPMLGLFCNSQEVFCHSDGVCFVPTTTACLSRRHAKLGIDRRVLDARHGRVLLRGEYRTLIVWDPITYEEWKVRFPPQCMRDFCWNATVLCSAAAAGAGCCDHLDCHRGTFVVVFVASVFVGPDVVETFIYTYSSNDAARSEPIYGEPTGYVVDFSVRSALVGSTLYFGTLSQNTILKYNMQMRQMSWIQLPSSVLHRRLSAITATLLTTTEDGGLQLSIEVEAKLYTWSTKDADKVDPRWEQTRVIELKKLLPHAEFLLDVVGSTDGLNTIFVNMDLDVVYAIDLMTYKATKVYEGRVDTIIPYMSFYAPELEVTNSG